MNEAVALVAQRVASSRPSGLLDQMRHQRAAPRRLAALRHEGIGPDLGLGEPRLHHRDQRADRGERELEADADHRLRLERDDREHGKREIAHRQRAPVEDHRAEHDQRHDQRALGADARAGRDVVGDEPIIATPAAHFLIG